MKGLLLKDWYLITRYCRFVYLMILAFIVGSLFLSGFTIFLSYPFLFGAITPVTLYSYDEREKWHIYSAALPVSRAQLVSAKYIIGLLSEAAVLLLSVVIRLVARPFMPEGAFDDSISVLIMSALSLVAPAVTLPLMFRLGAEKGRIAFTIVLAFFAAVFVVFMNNAAILQSKTAHIHPALLCVALALYAASWLLSIALYKKREF